MRRALLVGIDAYERKDDPNIPPLRGCLADVDAMAAFLKQRAGFQPLDIRILKDAQATTGEIERNLAWLTHDLGLGDRAVFFFSGHGTQMPEPLPPLKAERVLDAICPFDFDFSPSHVVSRRTLDKFESQVPGRAELLLICDSCHSGDIADPDACIKRVTPRSDQAEAVESALRGNRERLRFASAGGVALFAACRTNEASQSAIFDGEWHGVFTHFLLFALRDANGVEASLDTILSRVREAIGAAGYLQRPDLDALPSTRNLPFLG